MVERDQPAEDRLLPDATGRPRGRTAARTPPPRRGSRTPAPSATATTMSAVVAPGRTRAMATVHVLAAARVGVAHRRRGAAHREAAVVAGAVAEVAVQDVEERRVAGPDDAVAVDVRVRRAALARDGVDALDVLAAEVVEHLADQADALVLPHARAQERVELVVGRVDHRAGLGEQRDLVGGLDPAGLEEDLLPVDDVDALGLQRRQDRHLDEVDARRGSPARPCSRSTVATLRATSSAMPASGWKAPRSVEMPARARFGAVEPRVEQLVVAGGRAEVPEHRLAAARQHGEPDQLVHGPGADVGGRHVADVGEVEGEQARRGRSAPASAVSRASRSRAQPVEVDALLPVDRVGAVGADRHRSPASRCAGTSSKPSAARRGVKYHFT